MSPSSLSSCLPSIFSLSPSSTSSTALSSSSQTTSSHLTFSSFPPTNVPKQALHNTSLQVAIALLHDHRTYLSIFKGPAVTACHEIPRQSSAEAGTFETIQLLAESYDDPASASLEKLSYIASKRFLWTQPPPTSKWRYYTVTDVLPLPVRLIKSEMTYQVALRLTEDGIESLVLVNGYFILHNKLRIESRGCSPDEEIATEALWLVEVAEVKCWRGLGRCVEKSMAASRKSLHERYRIAWDGAVLQSLERNRG